MRIAGVLDADVEAAVPITVLSSANLDTWLETAPEHHRQWVNQMEFTAEPSTSCTLPGPDGSLARVLCGVGESLDTFSIAHLPNTLPAGAYELDVADASSSELGQLALGWALAHYRFGKYKDTTSSKAHLKLPESVDRDGLAAQVDAIALARDLINTGPNDLMPEHLAAEVQSLGATFGASVREVIGDALLEQNFPSIHAVGRASVHAPRLAELTWGDPSHPKIAVIGKGV